MILHWLVIITYKFEVLGYAGLCWPSLAFLAFVALDDFLSKNWPLLIKIKHNWPVYYNQMSKPITKRDRAFWNTVAI